VFTPLARVLLKKMTKVKVAKLIKRLFLVSLVFILFAELTLYMRPLPSVQPVVNIKNPTSDNAIAIPWPAYGQAAVGAEGLGVLEVNGTQKAAPIASVAKVMTAYSVLKQRPVSLGKQGPVISISDQDILTYNDYYSKGGSVARVASGEKITEYQAVQALMLPSANNFADTLAIWAFGSMDKYILYANNQAKALGLKDTHISDASGFSPQTLSSAHDLVLLGQAAIKNPVLAQIVNQRQATIPEAGTIQNVNWLLGIDNVNGIKTGNTEEAMGCFLFSSERVVAGQKITVVGAIMGAPDLNKAIGDSRPIITAVDNGFKTVHAVTAGQEIGYYELPWAGRAKAAAKKDLSFLVWQGSTVDLSAKVNAIEAPQPKGTVVGFIKGKADKKSAASEIILAQPVNKPSWKWRIFSR
jgi:D-alanyl-D-alanine carboxypeptidase (penicillin-binding protein 5/6)